MRVWAVSDIHTDYADNMEWLRQLTQQAKAGSATGSASGPSGPFSEDVLLVAGDVSDSPETLQTTLEICVSAFRHVFFVPGNHDLWVRRNERGKYDSLGKLGAVQALCARLGVHTAPARVGGVWIFPLYSWYSAEWDREPDVPGSMPISKVMIDFHACSWPAPLSSQDDSLAAHFDELNEPAFSQAVQEIEAETAAAGGKRPPIISFSHFLPRQELLPEKRMLFYPNLAKASGSDALEARVRVLRPLAHVFGHTHFSWDAQVEGIRYVQWPLGYPHEHRRRRGGGAGWEPLPLYDTDAGLAAPRDCYWSSYYAMNRRNPNNVSPAPWVAAVAVFITFRAPVPPAQPEKAREKPPEVVKTAAAGQKAVAAAAESSDGSSRAGARGSNSGGSSSSSSATSVHTGVEITVMAPDGKPTGETFELLDEPVPEDCHMEAHADYEGFAITWGLHYYVASAAQCCQRCKELGPRDDGRRCNVWVFCGDHSGRCWSRDIWNYTTGQCWLKSQQDWDGAIPPAATNLKAKRGPNNEEDRRLYGAPELVAWTAGVVMPS